MKVALFGAGRIGRVHAASMQAERRSDLVAVTDISAEAAGALAREHGIEARAPDDILADPGIDAILIATSTDTHADLIERGVRAGKAIFCEKPVDLDLARAHETGRIAAAHDRPVMMRFNRRFDPNFAALEAALDAGEVGRGELLSVTSFDPAPPPASYIGVSGGLFRDMAIHDFDMCAFLFGMPATVMAHGACLVDPGIGAAGDVDTARPLDFFLKRYIRAYGIEWSAFVDACVDGAPVPADIRDGINALALAEAATLSLRRGRPVEVTPELTGV